MIDTGAKETNVATEKEAMERATLDYLGAVDTVIEVDEVSGYLGEDSERFGDGTPIRVRVVATDNASIYHWNGEYLDPYWDVEIVEPHPAVPSSARSLFIYAPAYRLAGGGVS